MKTLNKIDIQKEFKEKGYVVCKNFFSAEEMSNLIENIKSGKTRNGVSGLNKGSLTFYSSLFFHNPSIRSFVSQPKIVDFLSKIIGPDFWVRWDQAVAKGSGSVTFPWHQDNGYSGLKDTHYQLWISLTKMTPENGGLWVVPGSHKQSLPHKRVGNHVEYDGVPENAEFIEAEVGDVVLFSSFMLHKTTPNTTSDIRWAYVIEYMSLEHFDPTIEPPYFIVSENGKSQQKFVPFYRASLNPINQLNYWKVRLLRAGHNLKKKFLGAKS